MRYTITNGEEYIVPDMCFYCRLSTAGQHEWGCPLHPDNLELKEKPMKVNIEMNVSSLRHCSRCKRITKHYLDLPEMGLRCLKCKQ